jgi:hypothetical protein
MKNPAVNSKYIDSIIMLMKLPSSSGSLERCFSTLNNIMTEKRNRLGVQKAAKLCSVYQTLNNISNNCQRKSKKRNFDEI